MTMMTTTIEGGCCWAHAHCYENVDGQMVHIQKAHGDIAFSVTTGGELGSERFDRGLSLSEAIDRTAMWLRGKGVIVA